MLQTGQHCNAAGYPAPQEADWIARNFCFNTGEVMSEVRLHYRTIGDPYGEPVLVLHGTTGTGASLLTPDFAGGVVRPRAAARCQHVFHHPSRRARSRWIVQAVRRTAHAIPGLQLRRHGARAAPASDRASEHPAPAPVDR